MGLAVHALRRPSTSSNTASFLFIKPAAARFAADRDEAKGASLPLALSPVPRPKANLQAEVTEQIPPAAPPQAAATSRLYHGSHPQFQAQLLSLQSCSLPSFLQTPHLCCHLQRCHSCRSIHPPRLPGTLLCPCHALFLATLTSPILETIPALTYHIFCSFPSSQSPVLLPLKSIRNAQSFQRERQDIISGQFPALS